MSEKSPTGSSASGMSTPGSNVEECTFLISNLHCNSTNVQHELIDKHFSTWGSIKHGDYLHVQPFEPANRKSVLHYTRSYVFTMDLTSQQKREILEDTHIIDGIRVSLESIQGSHEDFVSSRMEVLDGTEYKFHLFLRSFTDLVSEAEAKRLLEFVFHGITCRIHMRRELYRAKILEARSKDLYRYSDFYHEKNLSFIGDAVISFLNYKDFILAKEIVEDCFPGCIYFKWAWKK